MSGYKKPKKRLHRDFLYLNHDAVVNSLSALESGAIDEIIQKFGETSEGGFSGGVGYGSNKLSGSKKKAGSVEEELKLTRTRFSAFDSWRRVLGEEEAIGRLTAWDLETRNELEVGDTVEFGATVALSPTQMILKTFVAFADGATDPASPFKQPTAKVAEIKKLVSQVKSLLTGKGGSTKLQIYIAPLGVAGPRVIGTLDEAYLVAGADAISGEYTVIAQVESLLATDQNVPSLRMFRDVPPSQMETNLMQTAFMKLLPVGTDLGVTFDETDLTLTSPDVILTIVAIYR
ncbi:hypothetical protein EDF54_1582 [Rathayibacter sp. PhB93]|uniref:DUF6414 family protein n=1 Tax=unclassified Rathayibacter TaxID=2609250 RepID=UPI000F4AC908|nr:MULTISPECIES: hypothetical protein [unclassified Rathayibacter]ROQ06619.1 hypothetical protein EDF54_1582 [Rathayibacter sp. PhB93]TDQ14376.1 hypothetical protein EDF17_1401 [Rathayibacter sp. PhB1]